MALSSSSSRDLPALIRVCRTHPVPPIKSLFSQQLHIHLAVTGGLLGDQRSEADAEEVEAWEGDKVDTDLPQITVELP